MSTQQFSTTLTDVIRDQAALADADDLVRVWDGAAYAVAANMSWRENMGHRRGWQEDEPKADFAANLDRIGPVA